MLLSQLRNKTTCNIVLWYWCKNLLCICFKLIINPALKMKMCFYSTDVACMSVRFIGEMVYFLHYSVWIVGQNLAPNVCRLKADIAVHNIPRYIATSIYCTSLDGWHLLIMTTMEDGPIRHQAQKWQFRIKNLSSSTKVNSESWPHRDPGQNELSLRMRNDDRCR